MAGAVTARNSRFELAKKEQEMQNATPSRVISAMWLVALMMAIGCARSPGLPAGAAEADGTVRSQRLMDGATLSDESEDATDYDPWHSFNEHMFSFNHDVLDG